MKNSETKDFVAYEYLSINVKSELEPFSIDCYENFGWILVNNTALIDSEDYYLNANINNNKLVNLKFKRDRKIKNKVELLSLQRKMEAALKELVKLQAEPYSIAIMWALAVGLIGTVFLAISVFSITALNPLYVLGFILGIIGLIGWALGFFIFNKVKTTKESENVSLIEEQYNTIYDTCEQAKKLLD